MVNKQLVILLMGMIIFVGLVIAEGNGNLEEEFSNITVELVDSGYDWLINYLGQKDKLINCDNLILSNVNKLLTIEDGN